MKKSTRKRFGVITLATAAMIGGAPVVAEASTSEYGVNYVEFTATPRFCPSPGGALPTGYGGAATCSPFEMPSNTIYVQQIPFGDQWVFADLIGTGTTDDDVSIPATFAAQCSGFRNLVAAHVQTGSSEWGSTVPPEVAALSTEWLYELPVNTNNRTIPDRHLELDVPVLRIHDKYFDSLGPTVVGAPDSFIGIGEAAVASRMADGFSEVEARQKSWPMDIYIEFGGTVGCSGSGGPRYATDPEVVRIEVVFLGIDDEPGNDWRDATVEPPAPPARDSDASNALAAPAQVTQAELSVFADPADPCRLLLSGVVTTNQPMTVEYRFTDNQGVSSQPFTIDVDHTQVAFLDHHVDLPTHESLHSSGTGTLTPHHPGGDLQLSDEQTDRHQGVYHLEVTAPHAVTSPGAGFNVPACTGSSAPAQMRG